MVIVWLAIGACKEITGKNGIHNGRGRDSDWDIQGEIIGLQLSNPFFPY